MKPNKSATRACLTKTSLVQRDGVPLPLMVLLALLLIICESSRLRAQVVGATLSGTITDQSGAVIPNAKVSIKNVATGVVRVASTNQRGIYSAPNVLPGSYEVTVSASGFSSTKTTLTLTVGEQEALNLTLKVGRTTQTVEVTNAAPIVNLVNSTLGGLDNGATIRQLPLNGRSWTDLVTLQPGVTSLNGEQPTAASRNRYGRGFGTEFSISGARPQQNNYRLDGVSIEDPSNGGPGSILGGNLGVDAISQFSVLTGNFSAAYGRASGGIINAITKSGTNEFHGDAYEFLRNSALDAANFFDIKKPPFRRNQFGASVGGPIKKDKTFFFADYEGLHQLLDLTQNSFVPSLNARNGILSTGNVTVNPQATRFLNAFYPLPNTPTTGGVGSAIFALPQASTENFFTARLDQTLSEKTTLHGTYVFDQTTQVVPDEFDNKTTDTYSRRQYFVLGSTHSFSPRLVNDVRIGVIRDYIGGPLKASAVNPLTADASFGSVPGESAPIIIIPGLTAFSGGLSAAAPQIDPWTDWQAYDDAFYAKGIHAIKFGASVEHIQWNRLEEVRPGGQWGFASLSSFLTNQPLGFQADTLGSISPREIRQTIFGAYLEDDMRLRPNLTVNLGVRYEPATVVSEARGEVATLLTDTANTLHLGNPMYHNNTLGNVEPRIGFAWDPFKTGKTSIRGGFGIYDQLPTPQYFSNPVSSSPPFYQSINVVPGPNPAVNIAPGDFPANAFSKGVPGSLASDRVAMVQQNPSASYVMQYNFNIERELTPSLALTVGYVGSHAVNGINEIDDGNVVLPIASPQGYLWPCEPFSPITGCGGIGSGQRFNPSIGREPFILWRNSAVYNSLQVQVTKKMAHGLQVQGSFAWQKVIDTSSGANAADQFLNGISSEFIFNPSILRGPADYNTPRVLSINYLWQVPTPKSLGGLAGKFLGGWQLGGIISAEDGTPFTAFLAGDPLGLNSTDPFGYPNRLTGSGCSSLVNPGNVQNYIKVQCFAPPAAVVFNGVHYIPLGNGGRNQLSGPGVADWDFSLVKNIPVTERLSMQFRVEVFNLLNRPDFASPVDNGQNFILDPTISGSGIVPANPLTDAISTGAIDSTTLTSRQIQFALKFIF
ncbi:MAG TPA: TonB-dependent receptor [Terriglobia bacterium]|nr:TonB-dependent receptor [Terriglobia bacterium]